MCPSPSDLHVDLVVLAKDKVPTDGSRDEILQRVLSAHGLPQQETEHLVRGGQQSQVPCVLEGGSKDELQFITEPVHEEEKLASNKRGHSLEEIALETYVPSWNRKVITRACGKRIFIPYLQISHE